MKPMRALLLILLLTTSLSAFAQEMSQVKMFDDFNQLISIINNYYRARPIVEQRTHTNIDKELNLLKKECNAIHSKEEFAHLIYKALNVLNDKHSRILDADKVKSYISEVPGIAAFGNVSLADTLNANFYYEQTNGLMPKMRTGIRSKYINGHYYTSRSFTYNEMFVDLGEEITEINDIPISEYVEQNKYELFDLAWDEKNNKWYSELFWINKKIIDNKDFVLTIGNKDIALNSDITVKIIRKAQQFSLSPLVTTFDSMLYIRMPEMSNEQWYTEQIARNNKPDITKVIIDIRGNRGGGDCVWIQVLSSIIAKPLKIETNISMNSNDEVKRLLPLIQQKKSQILSSFTISPAKGSLNFGGDIYILQDADTYSAASSLASIAFQHKNITSVGYPLSHIGGRGLAPIIFRLNNSGIIFQMSFTADLSGKEANPYMNKVEVEMQQNIPSFLSMITNNQYDIEFLENKDLLINYVRKQIIKKS
jgi:C-terminal processing protease CtpA/Prc